MVPILGQAVSGQLTKQNLQQGFEVWAIFHRERDKLEDGMR